jgi:hypothetical protein
MDKTDMGAVKAVLYNGFNVSDKDDHEPTDLELEVWAVSDELNNLLLSKHRDYGPKNISQAPGGAINGLRVRMWDKMARINNLLDSNRHDAPAHESLEEFASPICRYLTTM